MPNPVVESLEKGSLFSLKGYTLHVMDSPETDLGNIFFTTANFNKEPISGGNEMKITGRGLDEYFRYYISHSKNPFSINPEYQYVDVGAGLGELAPLLVAKLKVKRKPIIIDPVDYSALRELLGYALPRFDKKPFLNKQIEELLGRIEIIKNPNEVRLLNMRLGEAVERFPDIHGCADVLVDVAGPITYCETEFRKGDVLYGSKKMLTERVSKLEEKILKRK